MPMAGPAGFKGKAALITGGSGGIGFRVAEQLSEAGAHLFINGRSAERGEQAAAKLREISEDVRFIALALTAGTPTWDRLFAGESFQRDLFTKVVERFPFGRPPSADEAAAVAAILASDAAAQVTGQTISVNGGLSFGGPSEREHFITTLTTGAQMQRTP
jgi:NAD(P)-dependent dehydrogenase (short-subunit alcohol dehydrogenase family)